MILYHVADSAGFFVIFGARTNAQALRNDNLYVVNVFLIPERLEDTIGEAEREKVLYRLFSHIMIDTVRLTFMENASDFAVELLGRGQVAPKGLFDHNACPGLLIPILSNSGVRQTSTTKLENDF